MKKIEHLISYFVKLSLRREYENANPPSIILIIHLALVVVNELIYTTINLPTTGLLIYLDFRWYVFFTKAIIEGKAIMFQ